MDKLLFGLYLLLLPVLCVAQEHKAISTNGFSINSVFSTRTMETSESKNFSFVTYAPELTLNTRYELIFQPNEYSTPIFIEPELGFNFIPIRYSTGDFSSSDYKERINNLSAYTGIAISISTGNLSFGYNAKYSLTLTESKKVFSTTEEIREWIIVKGSGTLQQTKFEHGFRLQYRGEVFRIGVYHYKTVGNWLKNKNSYYGNSLEGFSIGFSLGVLL